MADPDKPDKPDFNSKLATEQFAQAGCGLLAMLKAKRAAQNAENTRTLAIRSVQGHEQTILQLFEVGASIGEILAFLSEAVPSVPKADLQHAMQRLRQRHHHRFAPSGKPSHGAADGAAARSGAKPLTGAKTPAKRVASADTTITDLPDWADGSDKRSDETEEDYRLRKQFEGPPEAKRKFIGEHNT